MAPLDIVSASIVAPDGRHLLQRRDDKPGLPCATIGCSSGGQVKKDESSEAALRREVAEELGHAVRECH
jgi:8-oxo-dGTP pyrophosphatase MutT (NUDIX family)